MDKKLICPFCGREVRIVVCDDEGNIHPDEYEDDPWSGLGYMLVHEEADGVQCPIATEPDEPLGRLIYDSREEARKICALTCILQCPLRQNKQKRKDAR